MPHLQSTEGVFDIKMNMASGIGWNVLKLEQGMECLKNLQLGRVSTLFHEVAFLDCVTLNDLDIANTELLRLLGVHI